jgi:hypothetical protein
VSQLSSTAGYATGQACAVSDCPNPPRSRCLCNMHYQRWLRHGDPMTARPSRRRDLLLEDVAWLFSCGESAEEVCRRLDKAAATISRAAYRAGRPDLARPFERIAVRASRRARRGMRLVINADGAGPTDDVTGSTGPSAAVFGEPEKEDIR